MELSVRLRSVCPVPTVEVGGLRNWQGAGADTTTVQEKGIKYVR
jgi:hypothetical protein